MDKAAVVVASQVEEGLWLGGGVEQVPAEAVGDDLVLGAVEGKVRAVIEVWRWQCAHS